MSQRFEIIRESFDAFNDGRHEAWLANWDEDVVLHEVPEIPDRDLYVGIEGMREWLENLRGVFGDARFEPHTVEELGDFLLTGVDAHSGDGGAPVPVEWKPWIVFRFEGEKVAEAWGFLAEAPARQVAGLEDRVG